MNESITKETRIIEAKRLLLQEGYTISSSAHSSETLLVDEVTNATLPVKVECKSNLGLGLGFGNERVACEASSSSLYVEYYDGKLRVLAYADTQKDEPTHIIDLSSVLLGDKQPS